MIILLLKPLLILAEMLIVLILGFMVLMALTFIAMMLTAWLRALYFKIKDFINK